VENRVLRSDDEPAEEIRRAWKAIAGDGHGDIVDDLLARHGEPHRRYHTAEHVMWVLRHVRGLAPAADAAEQIDLHVLIAAALFHDAVYDPRSETNEADSAALAADRLARLGWSPERLGAVVALVLATAGHSATNAAEAVLLDADLAVLGGSPAQYQSYSAAVRGEYEHVHDGHWRIGRAAVLRQFLSRERIYATVEMASEREQRARQNLLEELRALGG